MDIENLINPAEIEELARQYGPIERRGYSLERGRERFEFWRGVLAERRGEVIFVVRRSAGLILHTKDTYPPGTYRLPSGGVSWGESVLSALHREVREEMGLEIEVERFLGLLEYEIRCEDFAEPLVLWHLSWTTSTGPRDKGLSRDEETIPFVSYVFLVRDDGGEPFPQDEEERILAFRQVPVAELAAVADSLRAVEEDWRDWGEFRAIAHDFVVEMMGGI